MLPQPDVKATSPAGTTNTVTNGSGQTAYVTVDANGATMADYWVDAVAVATSAAGYMMTVPAGSACALKYTVATPLWYWSALTPALPASTVAATNKTGRNLSVVIVAAGATVSAVKINGATTGITQDGSAPVPLPPGATIALTYSVAIPVWAWMDPLDLVLANSNAAAYAGQNTATPYSPLIALPYAQHAALAQSGLGTGVSN